MTHRNDRVGRWTVGAVLVALACTGGTSIALGEPPAAKPSVEALFSPADNCPERIVKELDQAKKTIRVRAATFTSETIAKAVAEAKKRGVDCEIIFGKAGESETGSRLGFAHEQGISTFIDGDHTTPQGSTLLIDEATVITGTLALTDKTDSSTAGDLLIIKGYPALAAKYAASYAGHHEHAMKYEGQTTVAAEGDGPTLVREGGATEKPTKKVAAAPKDGGTPIADASDGRCTAITKKGTRCTRKAKSDGKCWQHGG